MKVLVVFKNKDRNPTSTLKQIDVLVEDRIDIHKIKDFVKGLRILLWEILITEGKRWEEGRGGIK